MVNIIKITTTYPKSSRIAVFKETVVRTADSYREALTLIDELRSLNTNPNIEFKTSSIYR